MSDAFDRESVADRLALYPADAVRLYAAMSVERLSLVVRERLAHYEASDVARLDHVRERLWAGRLEDLDAAVVLEIYPDEDDPKWRLSWKYLAFYCNALANAVKSVIESDSKSATSPASEVLDLTADEILATTPESWLDQAAMEKAWAGDIMQRTQQMIAADLTKVLDEPDSVVLRKQVLDGSRWWLESVPWSDRETERQEC